MYDHNRSSVCLKPRKINGYDGRAGSPLGIDLLYQQKRILGLIRRRCVLTQGPDILRPVRPVRPDLRRNVPYVLTQRRNVSYVLRQRRVLPTSRLPQILPLVASSS